MQDRALTDPVVIEAAFLYAITWSLGGALVASGRLLFDKFLKKLSGITVGSGDEAQVATLFGSTPRTQPWPSPHPPV